nr:MAG TPA: hypothetical protein [Caudoviricetes sp.]
MLYSIYHKAIKGTAINAVPFFFALKIHRFPFTFSGLQGFL